MDLKPILITDDKAEEFLDKLDEAVEKEKDLKKEDKSEVHYNNVPKKDIREFFRQIDYVDFII